MQRDTVLGNIQEESHFQQACRIGVRAAMLLPGAPKEPSSCSVVLMSGSQGGLMRTLYACTVPTGTGQIQSLDHGQPYDWATRRAIVSGKSGLSGASAVTLRTREAVRQAGFGSAHTEEVLAPEEPSLHLAIGVVGFEAQPVFNDLVASLIMSYLIILLRRADVFPLALE